MRRWLPSVAAATWMAVVPAVAVAKYRGTDVWGNIAPADQTVGLADKYPVSFYGLDYHVDGPSIGLGGVSAGDMPAQIAQFFANFLFQASVWVMKLVLDIFDWAFSIDLLNGAHGALAPIGRATQNLYNGALGTQFMVVAVLLAGIWAVHKGLAQRRMEEVASGLALSVVLVAVAMLIILKPDQTVGQLSRMTNEMSDALLAGAGAGTTRQDAENHLFETFVYRPWVVMEFGGLKHCTGPRRDKDGFPIPVATNDPARVICRDHLEPHGGWGGYAPRFLNYPAGSDERNQLYEAMKDGKPNPAWPGWNVDKADAPAVDIQQAGGAYQRLLLSILIAFGVAGVVLMLGMLAFAALLAQVIALGLLAFAPAALLAGIFPGWGHRVFKGWLSKLGIAVFIKAIYSLVLAILIAVSIALSAAVGTVAFLFAFGLQAAFFWAVFLKRKTLAGVMMKQREVTRLERHTRDAVATPIAAAAGVGGVAAESWHRRRESRKEEQQTTDTVQEQAGKPSARPPEPTVQDRPVERVEGTVIPAAEPAGAGRQELVVALAGAKTATPEVEDEKRETKPEAAQQRTIREQLAAQPATPQAGNGKPAQPSPSKPVERTP